MIDKNTEEPTVIEKPRITSQAEPPASSTLLPVALCAAAFVVCILLTVAPLSRIPDTVIRLQMPIGAQLAQAGSWLPEDFSLATNHQASQANTNYVEFLALIALAFAIYGLCSWFIQRRSSERNYRQTLRLIWLGTLLAGGIYVLTPALLSHDILVYASYSRVLATYHANPYFVPLSAFPRDPFVPLNYWAHAVAVYGPIWLVVCSFFGFMVGPQPVGYVLAFRIFALAAHLLNIWLVTTTLRTMEQSSRTVTLGTLLYAWNPLVLLESSLGGHNDVCMVTFMLVGILLSFRAERKGILTHWRGFTPPLVAFMLAVLVKFTALPLLVLFIISLGWKALRPAGLTALTSNDGIFRRWQPTLQTVFTASIISGIVALVFYEPFWIGHSIHDIKHSFTSPPSALYAENSIFRAILAWNHGKLVSPHTVGSKLIQIFGVRKTWDYINLATLAGLMILSAVWLWKIPTTRTFVLATLGTLGGLLIVTPWFYSWYITWLVGLVTVCLPLAMDRLGRALFAFTLTFSASALLTYLYNVGYSPFGIWMGFICLTTVTPPLLAFLISFVAWQPAHQSTNRPTPKSHHPPSSKPA